MENAYVKLYVGARYSGLIRELGADLWQTLCALATYSDENGVCYPSMRTLAEDLGITERTVQRRICKLCDFQLNGKHIVRRVIFPGARNYVYQLLPGSFLVVEPDTDVVLDDTDVALTNNDIFTPFDITEIKKDYSLPDIRDMTARDYVNYFAKRYFDSYGINYVPNYGREGRLIKNKLLPAFGGDKLLRIIDYVIEWYPQKWATVDYPRPTIGQLASWLANRVAPLIDDSQPTATGPVNDDLVDLDYEELKRRGLL